MHEPQPERFDLARFVLGFLEQEGGVVAPPAFGIYEALLPEDLAADLGIDDFVRLNFSAENPPADADAVRLSVNHPLVETIAEQVTTQPANAMVYVNHVRLEKRGLLDLARKQFTFPNARVDGLPNREEARELHHYLQMNFKVAIISEEKQEELTTVMMDLQAGHAVSDPDLLHQLEIYAPEPSFESLPLAQPRWRGAGSALSAETLQAILPRAENALRAKLADRLTALSARIQHNLALDLARIEEYYDDLANDLRRRRTRLAETEVERNQSLDDKLAVLEAERRAKAGDVRGRYSLRVDMELVNALLIVQPKVTLPVSIGNRATTIERTVVWDPLMHRLEPLVCDACGQPGAGLTLCSGGHLAHSGCLAPQCIDCKRAYCHLCSAQIEECAVCHQPLCRQSLITCPTCKRGTCREHQTLCHAADGAPATLASEAPPTPPKTAEKSPPPASAAAAPSADKGRSSAAKGAAAKSSTAKKPPPTPTAKGVRIHIEIHETEPVVVAFVMRSTNRVWATRSFELTPKGILVTCTCEKQPCPATGYYHRPHPAAAIDNQIETMLKDLQREYLVPTKKVDYFHRRGTEVWESDVLSLPALWRDSETLAEAARNFDKMARSRS
ncbi:MAG: hypothetical protein KF893_11100 [Caldilineaceae bacterium]|nr:hypothetical protein [Caldilineaceae bacterium]